MREFFKGWRRKLGVVTLGIACVLTCGWVRSFRVCDSYPLTTKHSLGLRIEHNNGQIRCVQGFDGIMTGAWLIGNEPPEFKQSWSLEYWSFVMPLTVLSGWLLLRKSRSGKNPAPSPASEPDNA